MKDHAREKDTAAWLRQEYGDALPAFPVTADGAAGDVPWPKVQRRIAQLIKEDRFYTEAEQDRFDNIDPIAIREALAERGIVNGQVADPEKLDNDPFIRQVMQDVEAIAAEERTEPGQEPPVPDLSGQPVTREGDTITIGNGEPTHEIDITVSDEEYEAIQQAIPEEKVYDPAAPVYHEGDTVYLENQEYQITELREDTVQLLPSGMAYPIFRAESRERFEQLLKNDLRNGPITEFLSADPEKADQDLREVLTSGLFTWQDKEYISRWLRDGEGNTKIAKRLSELYSGRVETMELATGDIADYRTFTTSVEVEILDHEERKLATLAYRWDELAPLLRGMYVKELDGFFQDPEGFTDRHTSPLEGTPSYQVGDHVTLPAPDHPITGTIDAIEDTTVRIYTGPYAWSYDVISREQFETWLRQDERNAGLFTQEEKETPAPEITSEPVTVYPGDKNGLPYDVVVERLHIDETEPTPPEPAPPAEQAGHQRNTDHVTMNRYFRTHPEMVLGDLDIVTGPFGPQLVCNPREGADLEQQLHEAMQHIQGRYTEAELPELGEGENIDTSLPADPDVKNYSYTVVDGAVYYRENSRMVRPDLNATAEARVKGLVELRDCVQRLIDLEMNAAMPDAAIREQMAELNRLYDAFSAKYGLINDRANRLAFADDSSYYLLCALEVLDEDGRLERKADMFTKRTIKPHEAVASVDTAAEALAVSISEKACVDMGYMASLTGRTGDELAEELRGVIFQVPGQTEPDGTPHYVTTDEYLSGNVRQKLRQAQRAAERDPAFSINVEALTAAQPKDLDASEIEVRLGATWIDKEYIQQFMYETFKTPPYLRDVIEVNMSLTPLNGR